METTDRVSLDRSDFVGLDWIFDVQGSLERLLDRIDCQERAVLFVSPMREVTQ